MRAVVDEDLPRSLGATLVALDFEVLDIRDWGLRGKPDEEIFHFAQEHHAILFSGDIGFANTIEFPLGSHCGIVILRFPNELSTETINSIVGGLLAKISPQDYGGNLIILSPRRLRMRRGK